MGWIRHLEGNRQPLQTEETSTNAPKLLENQLLATKFFVPVASGTLISRPRLTALLHQSLEYPLTLISAPAGFGKTTLLSTWGQSLSAKTPKLAWVSLDEDDNEPQLFWNYILTALNILQPEHFTSLLTQLQSPQPPPLKYIVRALINALVEETEQFLLILDDYHLITEQQVHTTLCYLIEHLPIQLHIILSTRTDPPLLLSQLRARQQLLEVRTNQLRCTAQETKALFKEAMGIQLPEETIQEVTARTEGWLVGLQLLGLSLPEQVNPLTLLQETSGNQRYILDYLTEEVLRHQPQEIQTFLLSTCILERLSASLCDAVMQQNGGQQMLQQLEQANLFIVSLDSKRQWYRYHALFAETLHYRLEQMQADLVPTLHHRASLWYAEHNQTTQAIFHAFSARQWQWAADLIERHSLLSFTWGMGLREMLQLRQWLEQLPVDIMYSRPLLCLVGTQLLWTIAPFSVQYAWLNAAETMLRASLTQYRDEDISHKTLSLEAWQKQKKRLQEQEDLLGEVIASHAFLLSLEEDGQAAVSLRLQALSTLSIENNMVHVLTAHAQNQIFYVSSANNALATVQIGLQASSLAHAAGNTGFEILEIGSIALYMIGIGQLHETYRLTEQAILLGTQPGGLVTPDVGWPSLWRVEILREWNQLDLVLELAEEALSLCKQTTSISTLQSILCGYAVLLRVHLSRGDLEMARAALQEFECISMSMNQHVYLHMRSFFTTIDQVRLWLACGELDRATRWAQKLDREERQGTLLAHEREDVACARILSATAQPSLALRRLEPVLTRATAGQRWGHVFEIRLLQALAHQMLHQVPQALDRISEAVRLAEPEGYIRSFVDEGPLMATLLSQLREQQRKAGPTPYLDTLLTAFPQKSQADGYRPKLTAKPTMVQSLLDPLSARELEVLQLVAHGASNQEIAQKLVITIDTVKRHVSHIFSKLGVQNRVQAVRQAQTLGLLSEEP